MASKNIQSLAEDVRAGNRRALARAITLVESTKPAHRDDADSLLSLLLPHTGNSIRLGISGVPGVGKSTFIEAFGNHITSENHKLAVLAVDPSSRISGGSILGDKTRMETLSRNENAFIRPSPAGKTLGGVARRTREAMLLCEAAGFDVILVETVGVGQSETAVADMTDMFMLLLLPGGGDELQGIKKGIVELADIILVNKADGALENIAKISAQDYRNALHLLRPATPNWSVPVQTCSALQEQGIAEVWLKVSEFQKKLGPSGEITHRRAEQAKAWLWAELSDGMLMQLRQHPKAAGELTKMESDIAKGTQSPVTAARRLINIFLDRET